ncbi:collectin-11 [Biomphalaria glabrata]|nr:collectin-11 [Biomphalaria glabrata]
MAFLRNVIVALVTLFCLPFLKAALVTQVIPSTVDIGLTKNLKVECLFSRDKSSPLTFLTSLTLSHSESKIEPDYIDLLSINNFDSQINGEIQNNPNTQVFGAIDNRNKSFLGIQWEYPKVDTAGAYRCEAHGINQMGKPVSEFSNGSVNTIYPDTKQVVDQLQKLTQQVEQLQHAVNATEAKNNQLEKENKQLATLVSQIQGDTNSTSKQFTDLFTNLLFTSTSVYMGSRYLLSKLHGNSNYLPSISMCELLGGFIAEIDTAEEYTFVRNNLLVGTSYSAVFVSGTDAAQEGVWVHNYSKTNVKYFNWGPTEPNRGRLENCMAYYRPSNWLFVDLSCDTLYAFDSSTAFVCEVPQKI